MKNTTKTLVMTAIMLFAQVSSASHQPNQPNQLPQTIDVEVIESSVLGGELSNEKKARSVKSMERTRTLQRLGGVAALIAVSGVSGFLGVKALKTNQAADDLKNQTSMSEEVCSSRGTDSICALTGTDRFVSLKSSTLPSGYSEVQVEKYSPRAKSFATYFQTTAETYDYSAPVEFKSLLLSDTKTLDKDSYQRVIVDSSMKVKEFTNADGNRLVEFSTSIKDDTGAVVGTKKVYFDTSKARGSKVDIDGNMQSYQVTFTDGGFIKFEKPLDESNTEKGRLILMTKEGDTTILSFGISLIAPY